MEEGNKESNPTRTGEGGIDGDLTREKRKGELSQGNLHPCGQRQKRPPPPPIVCRLLVVVLVVVVLFDPLSSQVCCRKRRNMGRRWELDLLSLILRG